MGKIDFCTCAGVLCLSAVLTGAQEATTRSSASTQAAGAQTVGGDAEASAEVAALLAGYDPRERKGMERFAAEPLRTIGQVAADIPAAEVPLWAGSSQRAPYRIDWLKTFGRDEQFQPKLLITLHDYLQTNSQLMRLYAVRGNKYAPSLQIGGRDVAFGTLQFFYTDDMEFIVVERFDKAASAVRGQFDTFVVWVKNGACRLVDIENPVARCEKLHVEGERGDPRMVEVINLRQGKATAVGFRYYIYKPGTRGTRAATGKVVGTYRLVKDAEGRPTGLVVDTFERRAPR